MTATDMKAWLARCPLVAILRGVRPEEVEAIGDVLLDAGFAIIEVPLNSPDPIESIRRLAARCGARALVGAGTVLDPADCARIAAAGGRLVVTPHADPEVVRAAKVAGMFAVPGFMTPGEAFALLRAGADGLKLFPAEAASPAVVKALLAVLPTGTAILPVGGIEAGTMGPWRAAGAAGFGIGSAIYKPGDSAATVAGKARRLMEALTPPSA